MNKKIKDKPLDALNFSDVSIKHLSDYISEQKRLSYEEVLWQFRIDPKRRDPHKLINTNLSMVLSIANKMFIRHLSNCDSSNKTCNVSFIDLFQAGIIGLCKAIEKFDSRKQCKFSTYAYPWIQQCIRQEIKKSIYPLETYKHNIYVANRDSLELQSHVSEEKLYDEMHYDEILDHLKDFLDEVEYNLFLFYFIEQKSMSEIAIELQMSGAGIQYRVKQLQEKIKEELIRIDVHDSL